MNGSIIMSFALAFRKASYSTWIELKRGKDDAHGWRIPTILHAEPITSLTRIPERISTLFTASPFTV